MKGQQNMKFVSVYLALISCYMIRTINRAHNNCLQFVRGHLLEIVTLLQIVNDSPIENAQ